MASINSLTKTELLEVLKSTPQKFWPPRPTRQDKSTLVDCIRNAHYSSEATRDALAKAWKNNRK